MWGSIRGRGCDITSQEGSVLWQTRSGKAVGKLKTAALRKLLGLVVSAFANVDVRQVMQWLEVYERGKWIVGVPQWRNLVGREAARERSKDSKHSSSRQSLSLY